MLLNLCTTMPLIISKMNKKSTTTEKTGLKQESQLILNIIFQQALCLAIHLKKMQAHKKHLIIQTPASDKRHSPSTHYCWKVRYCNLLYLCIMGKTWCCTQCWTKCGREDMLWWLFTENRQWHTLCKARHGSVSCAANRQLAYDEPWTAAPSNTNGTPSLLPKLLLPHSDTLTLCKHHALMSECIHRPLRTTGYSFGQ